MKLIVGLGNPGEKYKNNRHNVGYMFVDYIASLLHCSIVKKEKSYITMKQLDNLPAGRQGETIILVKPTTFMNLSGQAVKKLIENLKLKIENLVIVHDDLDIPLGKFKIQKGVGPKLHNGIESIENALGSKDFWRVRIGIDNRNPENWVDGEIYTLQDFKPLEKKIIWSIFPKILGRLKNELIPKL